MQKKGIKSCLISWAYKILSGMMIQFTTNFAANNVVTTYSILLNLP